MPLFLKNHIIIHERTESLAYTSNSTGRNIVIPRTGLNREEHGTRLIKDFTVAATDAGFDEAEFVYITFRSAWGFLLDLDKLDKRNFRLSSYRRIDNLEADNPLHFFCYEATVCLNKNAVSEFLVKVEDYINRSTPKGNPFNQPLIANIDEIRAATIESFWQEPEIAFPDHNENTWWEIWLNRDGEDNIENPLEPYQDLLSSAGVEVGRRKLKFPEHWVFLMHGTAEQLAASLLYTDKLSEIRKPRDTADFFTYLDFQEQTAWIADLAQRVDHNTQSTISVCLLDTGVNIAHPLLSTLIPARNLDSVEPAWSKADTHVHGHGTPMAGLALYGDLIEPLATRERIQINHHLESVKLIERNQPHLPELYGAVTQEAIARGITLNPANKRLMCMAVTSDAFIHKGRPSAWSSAIDQSIFGTIDEPNTTTLFFVSSGNLSFQERINYPLANNDCSIEDPAQAFNALTVGAYTLKDQVNFLTYPGSELLAMRGGMSPCNTTSVNWDSDWCRKPDVVMEGGNQAIMNGGVIDPDSMQLLSTSKGGIGRSWFTGFGDTSGATALAAKFAAELYYAYSELWPETIRGLIIHSASWTPAMLGNRLIQQLSEDEKKKLISLVGYGVPNMERAKYSANNSLSLIAERVLKPYKKEGSIIKTEEFHLFDLPWPIEVLQELFDTQVKLTITLSYFIEPNPGNKKYELAASYRSHGLRFKMIDKNESPDVFKARISKDMRNTPYEREGGEHWILGNKVRDKGSIHKDIWEGSAADLATRNKIAVYPVGGWWKTRNQFNRFNSSVRYSLIVTIDAPANDIDLYTPVENQIAIDL